MKNIMKFKVGDKVKHKDFGVGEIIGFDDYDNQYAVEYWCWDDEIELVEEAPQNLIPQIAKMLGVEIGEEFGIGGGIYKFNEYDFVWVNSGKEDLARNVFYSLLKNEYTIQKLPQTPKLTEAERVILENLDKEYKWIARLGEISNNSLMIYVEKPVKNKGFWTTYQKADILSAFSHLFTFIKWEDSEAYNIKELLEE